MPAQGYSFSKPKTELSVNGTAWTDISSFVTALELSGGDRSIAEAFVADSDTPVLTAGKRASLTITIHLEYTEGASDPFEVMRPVYEGGGTYYVRWSPRGGATGQFQFTSDAGYIVSPFYPVGDVSAADAVLAAIVLQTPKVTKGTAA